MLPNASRGGEGRFAVLFGIAARTEYPLKARIVAGFCLAPHRRVRGHAESNNDVDLMALFFFVDGQPRDVSTATARETASRMAASG
jgi:hypothetical protein